MPVVPPVIVLPVVPSPSANPVALSSRTPAVLLVNVLLTAFEPATLPITDSPRSLLPVTVLPRSAVSPPIVMPWAPLR